MNLASFDIFDTTLLRRCGQPEGTWEHMASTIYGEMKDVAEAFVAWRQRAKDDTLPEIYASIDKAFLTLAEKTAEEMEQAERDAERQMLVANPAIQHLIDTKRQEGKQIAFISDMYLDSCFLRQVLTEQGCCREEDFIYVSCEHRARKDRGTLYDLVRHELHPQAWEHYGDNQLSDVRMARKKGIHATLVDTSFTEVEKVYADILPQGAAVSRLYRLLHPGNIFAAFAADFVVPAYLPYAIYILAEARRMGIKRLYFLSRDSYVLLEAARMLMGEKQDIELHYLFVSRRALLLPYIHGGNENTYLAACDHQTIVRIDTVDKRLKHLGTSREELRRDYGIEFGYAKANNLKEQADFLQKIFHSDFTPLLQRRAREQHRLLMDYFRQEGLCDGEKCAAVDVGWLGTSRLMMNHLLRQEGELDLHFFYYGVRGDVFPPSAGRYSAYFQNGEMGTNATVLLEHYYSASPYPSTIGYSREVDGKVKPWFGEDKAFLHTSVSQTNVEAIKAVAAAVSTTDSTLLRQCAKASMAAILSPHMKVDISPLTHIGAFDDHEPFVKRLSPLEMLRIVALGDHVTGFDLGSLRITLPHSLLPMAWRMHEWSRRVRGYLYKRKKR